MAQTFEVSGAPSNGQWAENTHWYTITLFNNSDYYFRSDEDGTDPDGNLLLRETTKSADALWCVVKDGDNYTFYNYVDGPSKVLGSTGSTTGKEGSGGRLKMYAKGTEGVVTSYTRANGKYSVSGDADAFCEPRTNHYFNYRDGYLSFWNNDGAAGGKGSACRFVAVNTSEIATLVSSSYDAIVAKATSVKNGMNGHVGELFAYSQENYDKLISLIPATKPASVEDQVKAVRALKDFFATVEAVMPVTGYYTLKNYSREKYLDATFALTNSSVIASTNDNYQSEAWLLTKNNDGTYSLKNYISGSYILGSTDTQNFNVSTNYSFSSTAQNFKFYPNYGGRALTAVIGTGNQCRNISVNASGTVTEVVQGNKIGEDCSWSLVKVDDPTTLNRDGNAYEALKIARLLPVLADNVNTTLTAYAAERSETNATAFADAVNACTYVRFKNVGTDLTLGATDIPHGFDWSDKDANLIWKLEMIDDAGTKKIKLHHLNTDKYLSAVTGAYDNGSGSSFVDLTNGATWTFTNNGENFTIKDGGNGVMHCESNGNINQWHLTDNAKWYVTLATDIQVDLNKVNGKSYATTYLPFPVSAIAGAKAYVGTFNDAQTAITLTEKSAIPANEGVVLISDDAAATATLTIGGNAVKEGTNAFSGTNTAITFSDGDRENYRVLGPKASDTTGSSIGFFKPSNTVESIPANRAFVYATSTSTPSSVSVNFGTVEGLGSIVTETSEDANSPIYDLSGRRVMHTVKGGLYIRNGKKFLVK